MMEYITFGFDESRRSNPCIDCPSPCCKHLLLPIKPPNNLMDLDYVQYILNFPNLQIAVSNAGEWNVVLSAECRHFDQTSHSCRSHDTDKKPLTCQYYNPHQCWYKRNLEVPEAPEMYLLDFSKFVHWVKSVKFGKNREIVSAPDFETSKQILANID